MNGSTETMDFDMGDCFSFPTDCQHWFLLAITTRTYTYSIYFLINCGSLLMTYFVFQFGELVAPLKTLYFQSLCLWGRHD